MGLLALDAAARIAPRGAHLAGRRPDSAGRSGSLPLEPGTDRRRDCAGASGRLSSRRFGPYTLQAAIAAVHAAAPNFAATDWAQIVALYDLLVQVAPSPVVEINRAVAVAMRDGPAAGLALIDAILARGDLADYHLAHSARADLCRRLGRTAKPEPAYQRALALAQQEPERRFLERRLATCRTEPAKHEFSKLIGRIVEFGPPPNDYLM